MSKDFFGEDSKIPLQGDLEISSIKENFVIANVGNIENRFKGLRNSF